MFYFVLTAEQTDLIGAALSKMPYASVVDLMNSLRAQVDQQLAAKQENSEPVPDPVEAPEAE